MVLQARGSYYYVLYLLRRRLPLPAVVAGCCSDKNNRCWISGCVFSGFYGNKEPGKLYKNSAVTLLPETRICFFFILVRNKLPLFLSRSKTVNLKVAL